MQRIVIKNLPEAMNLVKEMHLRSDDEWTGDYRIAAKDAIAQFLKDRMDERVTHHLSYAHECSISDRKNGSYLRHLLTEIGDVLLTIPRTRTYSPKKVIVAYARRCKEVDRLILACFLLGLSTRKVGKALLAILGEKVSPSTVSRVAKTLDDAVMAFHKRRLNNLYKALIFDGVVLSRRTGAGAIKRPVLVALGIRYDGKKEIIDFRVSSSESATEWELFLTDLYKRGLTGEEVGIISVDGGKGLLAALPVAYPNIPIQRCWAHKMRNIIDKVRKKDRKSVKEGLVKIYSADDMVEARSLGRKWADRWQTIYPKAVKCLKNDLDELLTCFQFKDAHYRKSIRTTNAIERVFKEVRRRTRPMGVFSDRTSMERILYAVFTYENESEGVYPVFMV